MTSDPPDTDGPASTRPDLSLIAERMLDLWQDQMAASARDPATVALVVQALAGTGVAASAMAPFLAAWQRAAEASARAHAAKHRDERAPDGAEAAASTPDPGGIAVGDILRRLEELENRLAELDPDTGKS